MAEKASKNRGLFISLKRWGSQSKVGPASPGPASPGPASLGPASLGPASPSPGVVNRTMITVTRPSQSGPPSPKEFSATGIEELIQCSLCLEDLHNPKMLPCQHTFCFACLTVYSSDLHVFDCPTCRTRIQVTSPSFIDSLPSNLYIDSLLNLVKNRGSDSQQGKRNIAKTEPTLPGHGVQSVQLFAGGVPCSQCKTVCDSPDVTSCQHCKQKFCRLCWGQHMEDIQTQVASILKQLDTAAGRIDHKIEDYKDRCEHLTEQINLAADEKINEILESKDKLLKEAATLTKTGDINALALKISLNEARVVAKKAMNSDVGVKDADKVFTFINLHQNTLQLLSDISKWDSERFIIFNKENFSIEVDAATPLYAESDEPLPADNKTKNPLENENSLMVHYRSRNFIPHFTWRKTSRPGGVGVDPWNNYLYICGMDTHSVLVIECSHAKIVARLSSEEMLCPVHVAFMKSLGEVYVTDKWKHCIHVFSKEGSYIRTVGSKGSRAGMFRSPEGIATDERSGLLYVSTTGNDRVQVMQPDGKVVDLLGVVTKNQVTTSYRLAGWQAKEVTCTELNAPTDVALTHDRVIILDSGNRRVKVYNKKDKQKILEFGSLGQRKGQFRQPEVLTVDALGFIFVGDSGNSRVQVFKPNGQLVRVFGGYGAEPGKFGWISGIHVTPQLDVIISDTKNHSVNFI
ncbi:RING finger protein nhl-1 [Plutella xylostella]|uniref:RING finger protein nhl-1 n=1 Tax=Plutella xylostella TaxID=51655 RepID=UPI0020328AD6|nr:RING finger protein nhl-1 [Plutella xylostella]